jgi:DNA primase catalytic subunit
MVSFYPIVIISLILVPKDYMERREIAFIFEGDKHHRFQTFKFPSELESELIKRRPYKIDIGAVYNVAVVILLNIRLFVILG